MVGLDEEDLHVELDRPAAERCMDVVEGLGAVDLGLTRPEQVQVGPVEDEDAVAVSAGHDRIAVTGGRVGAAADDRGPTSTFVATCRTRSSGTSASITQPSSVGRTQRS